MESRLIECDHPNNNVNRCDEDAGLVCCKHITHMHYFKLVNHLFCHHACMLTDKQPEETATSQCATVPTEAEKHTACPPLTDSECDCTCPSTEVNNTECPTPETDSTGNMADTDGARVTTYQCDCTCPIMETSAENKGGTDEQQKTEAVTCTALGGGLGTLAAVLILILVGMVLGWVWSCHRNKSK